MMVAVMMVVALTANAQNEPGKMAIGANLNYGMHKDYKNIGFGAKFQYNITDAIRGEASGNYFLKKDGVSFWNVEVNAEYLFKVGDAFTIYPLAGLDLLGTKVGDYSDSELGLNLGAGVEYQLSENLALKAEYNYKTQGNGWSLLKFGVVIPF